MNPLEKAQHMIDMRLGGGMAECIEALVDAKLGDKAHVLVAGPSGMWCGNCGLDERNWTRECHGRLAPAEPTAATSESPDYVPGGTTVGSPSGYSWLRQGDTPRPKPDSPIRPHIVDGKFQSDKYPTCPPGKVPLSVEDPMAQDLLWEYARRRQAVDAEFASDLEFALMNAGYTSRP